MTSVARPVRPPLFSHSSMLRVMLDAIWCDKPSMPLICTTNWQITVIKQDEAAQQSNWDSSESNSGIGDTGIVDRMCNRKRPRINDSDNVDKHHLELAGELQLQLAVMGVYSGHMTCYIRHQYHELQHNNFENYDGIMIISLGGILLYGHESLEGLSTLAVSVSTR